MADRRERALDRVRRAQVLSARQGSRRRQAALRDPSSVLADNGAVLAICAHTQSNVEERAEELRQAGARVLAVAASLTDEAQVRILGISIGYLRTSGHQVTWSFGTKDTYERTRRHNDLSRERPPEFPRAALLIRRFILCGARRVGAGGRNSGAIGATGGCCSNREEVSAPVAALRISPPCDDAGTSLGLPPI